MGKWQVYGVRALICAGCCIANELKARHIFTNEGERRSCGRNEEGEQPSMLPSGYDLVSFWQTALRQHQATRLALGSRCSLPAQTKKLSSTSRTLGEIRYRRYRWLLQVHQVVVLTTHGSEGPYSGSAVLVYQYSREEGNVYGFAVWALKLASRSRGVLPLQPLTFRYNSCTLNSSKNN